VSGGTHAEDSVKERNQAVDIQRYLRVLLSRKAIIILTADLALLVVLVGTLLSPRAYTASALLRVSAGAAQGSASFDPNYQARLQETSLRLLTSRPLLEQTISQLHLDMMPDQLAGMVNAQGVPNTELIQVNVTGTNPQQAASIANMLSSLFSQQGQAVFSGQGKSAQEILQGQITAMDQQLRTDRAELAALPAPAGNGTSSPARDALAAKVASEVATYTSLLDQLQKAGLNQALAANGVTMVQAALPPDRPSSPRVALNLVLGLVLGLVGGAGLALLLEQMNPAVRSAEELQTMTKAPLLGQVPLARTLWSPQRRPVLLQNVRQQSVANEAFRRLATSTLFVASRNRCHTLVLTSARPHAGKSTVVANLALGMAQAGREVIVVDGDLRHPALHGVFGLPQGPGLSDVLVTASDAASLLQQTQVAHVRVLTSGAPVGAPGDLLSAGQLRKLMDRLASQADIVLWDSPPILAVADAAIAGSLADGVLLVTAQDGATAKDIEGALKELDRAGGTLLGVIYNRVRGDNLERYYSSYVASGGKRPQSGVDRTTARPTGVDQAAGGPMAGGPVAAGAPRANNAVESSNHPRTAKG
jgi:capsular exopolysaccharide synthesis family protein